MTERGEGSFLEEQQYQTFLDAKALPSRADVRTALELVQDNSRKSEPLYKKVRGRLYSEDLNEIFTEEYIRQLSLYISERAGNSPTSVLEICAGDGRLSHFLSQFAEANVTFQATDKYANTLYLPTYPVEGLSAVQAITDRKPDIVLCSWMPKDVEGEDEDYVDEREHDIAQAMVVTPSVKEFILIGDPTKSGGWNPDLYPGFEPHELPDLSKLNINRWVDPARTLEHINGVKDMSGIEGDRTVSWKRKISS